MPLTIRPIQASDHAAWLPLWQGYIEFYQGDVSDAQTTLTWQRMLDAAQPLQGWVAERDRQLIGMAHIFMHDSTWSDRGYCYLEDLFVSEAARGQGVARQLIEHCKTWATRQGAGKLYWLTQETNHTARQLYDKVAQRTGFIHYEIACQASVNQPVP
jgi:GNAT superfamily N-acetyltransferase